jgi:hypothetical protein
VGVAFPWPRRWPKWKGEKWVSFSVSDPESKAALAAAGLDISIKGEWKEKGRLSFTDDLHAQVEVRGKFLKAWIGYGAFLPEGVETRVLVESLDEVPKSFGELMVDQAVWTEIHTEDPFRVRFREARNRPVYMYGMSFLIDR